MTVEDDRALASAVLNGDRAAVGRLVAREHSWLVRLARFAHSFAYLAQKQPWRTISFVIGGLDTLVMVGFLAKTLTASA